MNNIVFPHSPANDGPVDDAMLADIREEALNAFFKVVADRLDDLYPGSRTVGDIDPLFARHLEEVDTWIRAFALNNSAVATATHAAMEC